MQNERWFARLLDLFNEVDDHVVAAGRSLLSTEKPTGPTGRLATGEPETIDHLLLRIEELTKRLAVLESLLAKPESSQ